MTARVLVVDDIPANVKLLEAKLGAEYFDVVTAGSGPEALSIIEKEKPDIVLLDVMMPGMDGFEVCRRIKTNPVLSHIPVVMVTALDQVSDRVQGLQAGADDFLTKPVNDIALFARVRSLVRIKTMVDELRLRQATGESMGLVDGGMSVLDEAIARGRILIVEDREQSAQRMAETLGQAHDIEIVPQTVEAVVRAKGGDFDLVISSLSLDKQDGLRFCATLRSLDATRQTPILAIVDEGDLKRLVRALDIGVNDYLMRPVERHELVARVNTQLRRKRFTDKLKHSLQLSLEMAITDQLTGLFNRRYMSRHLGTLIGDSTATGKPVSFLIMDIDYFKQVNDTYGHDVGDEVLREFANRVSANVRGIDLACRYGGEEFVVVMPDTDMNFAYMVAERLRQAVADAPFHISTEPGQLPVTISIGVTCSEGTNDTAEGLLKRADKALYRAKRDGRNRVVADAA
jgi:two-component system, cell cycle response regulator